MSEFKDQKDPIETFYELEKRHKHEARELEGKIRAMMKTAKKSTRPEIEAKALQMQYDLKAKHREEEEALEELTGQTADELTAVETVVEPQKKEAEQSEEELAALKKAKAKKKKDKKAQKEQEKLLEKERIKDLNSGPSLRDIELNKINNLLRSENLQVKIVASDGNCLYRAISDQLVQSSIKNPTSEHTPDHLSLRVLAANFMRTNPEEFCPFLGLDLADPEFENYCQKVASDTLAEWGGQLELKALSSCLQRKIDIYSADAPVVQMGVENDNLSSLKVTYHRHFYSLGEHYNSVAPIENP